MSLLGLEADEQEAVRRSLIMNKIEQSVRICEGY